MMRTLRMVLSSVLITALAIGQMSVSSVPVSAHDDECVQRAWDVPMETIEAPKDWEWEDLSASPDRLVGFLQRSKGEPYLSPMISVSVLCVHDPAGMMARNEKLRGFLGNTKDMDVPAHFGADASAHKVTGKRAVSSGDMVIQWRRGDLFAEVEGMLDFKGFDTLVELATDLDALLPASEVDLPTE